MLLRPCLLKLLILLGFALVQLGSRLVLFLIWLLLLGPRWTLHGSVVTLTTCKTCTNTPHAQSWESPLASRTNWMILSTLMWCSFWILRARMLPIGLLRWQALKYTNSYCFVYHVPLRWTLLALAFAWSAVEQPAPATSWNGGSCVLPRTLGLSLQPPGEWHNET